MGRKRDPTGVPFLAMKCTLLELGLIFLEIQKAEELRLSLRDSRQEAAQPVTLRPVSPATPSSPRDPRSGRRLSRRLDQATGPGPRISVPRRNVAYEPSGKGKAVFCKTLQDLTRQEEPGPTPKHTSVLSFHAALPFSRDTLRLRIPGL